MAINVIVLAVLLLGVTAQKSQTSWGQCGGSDYDGPTRCPDSFYCTVGNPWYSQCVPLPGTPDEPIFGVPDSPIETTSFATVITVTRNIPTVVTTYITFLTPKPTTPAQYTPPPAPTSFTLVPDTPIEFAPDTLQLRRRIPNVVEAGADVEKRDIEARQEATPKELKKGQYWIRAVTDPHYHDYLQTNPQNAPGTAILGSYTSAGQYNITADGQLVSGGTSAVLYMHVEKPVDLTQRKLATWFNTTKNEWGKFVFSGDAVTWSTPEVKRQNLAAWLVCEKGQLFINTGAYAYQTPVGCSDHTIHYYNGATANH